MNFWYFKKLIIFTFQICLKKSYKNCAYIIVPMIIIFAVKGSSATVRKQSKFPPKTKVSGH